jgi:hypothetical protein
MEIAAANSGSSESFGCSSLYPIAYYHDGKFNIRVSVVESYSFCFEDSNFHVKKLKKIKKS